MTGVLVTSLHRQGLTDAGGQHGSLAAQSSYLIGSAIILELVVAGTGVLPRSRFPRRVEVSRHR